jgi:hypothetical protein
MAKSNLLSFEIPKRKLRVCMCVWRMERKKELITMKGDFLQIEFLKSSFITFASKNKHVGEINLKLSNL